MLQPVFHDPLPYALALGMVAGVPLRYLFLLPRLERVLHRLAQRTGERLNRPSRPFATRVSRGFFVPLAFAIGGGALGAAVFYVLLEYSTSMAGYYPIKLALLAALLSPHRFLVPLGMAIRGASRDQWHRVDAALRDVASGSYSASDGHGAVRELVALSVRLYVHQFAGSLLYFLLGGWPALLAYRGLQLCAQHYDGRIGYWHGFHWASQKMAAVVALPVWLLAAPFLLVAGAACGCLSWRGLLALLRGDMALWAAHSLNMALGGPAQRYGQVSSIPWQGTGSAKAGSAELMRCFFWLTAASLLLGTAGIALSEYPLTRL